MSIGDNGDSSRSGNNSSMNRGIMNPIIGDYSNMTHSHLQNFPSATVNSNQDDQFNSLHLLHDSIGLNSGEMVASAGSHLLNNFPDDHSNVLGRVSSLDGGSTARDLFDDANIAGVAAKITQMAQQDDMSVQRFLPTSTNPNPLDSTLHSGLSVDDRRLDETLSTWSPEDLLEMERKVSIGKDQGSSSISHYGTAPSSLLSALSGASANALEGLSACGLDSLGIHSGLLGNNPYSRSNNGNILSSRSLSSFPHQQQRPHSQPLASQNNSIANNLTVTPPPVRNGLISVASNMTNRTQTSGNVKSVNHSGGNSGKTKKQSNRESREPHSYNQPATAPVVNVRDGVEWITFHYTNKGRQQEYSIRVDMESVSLDMIPIEFRNENCIYPRALCPQESYNRLDYETTCNELAWKLTWLNPATLSGRRGLIQRAVDSYRNRFPETRSRRVVRQEKIHNGTLRRRTTEADRSSSLSNVVGSISGGGSVNNAYISGGSGELQRSHSSNILGSYHNGNNVGIAFNGQSPLDDAFFNGSSTSYPYSMNGLMVGGSKLAVGNNIQQQKPNKHGEQLHQRAAINNAKSSGMNMSSSNRASGPTMLTFHYTTKGQSNKMTLNVNIASVDVEELDYAFKRNNAIYARALAEKDIYDPSLVREYENESNEIGWKLAWLNPKLTEHKAILHKAVEAFRAKFDVTFPTAASKSLINSSSRQHVNELTNGGSGTGDLVGRVNDVGGNVVSSNNNARFQGGPGMGFGNLLDNTNINTNSMGSRNGMADYHGASSGHAFGMASGAASSLRSSGSLGHHDFVLDDLFRHQDQQLSSSSNLLFGAGSGSGFGHQNHHQQNNGGGQYNSNGGNGLLGDSSGMGLFSNNNSGMYQQQQHQTNSHEPLHLGHMTSHQQHQMRYDQVPIDYQFSNHHHQQQQQIFQSLLDQQHQYQGIIQAPTHQLSHHQHHKQQQIRSTPAQSNQMYLNPNNNVTGGGVSSGLVGLPPTTSNEHPSIPNNNSSTSKTALSSTSSYSGHPMKNNNGKKLQSASLLSSGNDGGFDEFHEMIASTLQQASVVHGGDPTQQPDFMLRKNNLESIMNNNNGGVGVGEKQF